MHVVKEMDMSACLCNYMLVFCVEMPCFWCVSLQRDVVTMIPKPSSGLVDDAQDLIYQQKQDLDLGTIQV